MNKLLLNAIVCVTVSPVFTSCLGSGEARSMESLDYSGNNCFNYVTDNSTGESFITTSPVYFAEMDMLNLKANLSISNLQLVNGGSSLAFKFAGLPITVDNTDYSYNIKGTHLTPENSGSVYTFDSFSLKYTGRWITIGNDTGSYPVVNISYDVTSFIGGEEKSYSVTVMPKSVMVCGELSVVPDDPNADGYAGYTSPSFILGYSLNTVTGKADVYFFDIKINESMMASKFHIENVPYTLNPYGIVLETNAGETYPLKDASDVTIADSYVSDMRISTILSSGNTRIFFKGNLGKFLTDSEPFNADGTLYYFNK